MEEIKIKDFVASGVPLAPFDYQRWYCPRFWHGMSFGDWINLLAENRFRIYYKRVPIAASVFPFALIPTVSNRIQSAMFGEKAEEKPLVDDPIILIGHWRSGTTLLHELFTLDEQFCFPTTFQCFNPLSFMISEKWLKFLTQWMLPSSRPMDNVRLHWGSPQEDEFALLNMGMRTPYRGIAWPNGDPVDLDYLDMTGLSESDEASWKAGLMQFVRYLNLYYGRRLVLKSPPHTGRIRTLLEMFPNARFVHITRDPDKLIPSTMHLWASLYYSNAMRRPHLQNVRDYVFTCFERMYASYFRNERLLNERNLITIRFEDLVKETEPTMRRIYDQLALGDFESYAPLLREHLAQTSDYQRNQHELPAELQDEISQRCGEYRERFTPQPRRRSAA